jgi:hypothetical protein
MLSGSTPDPVGENIRSITSSGSIDLTRISPMKRRRRIIRIRRTKGMRRMRRSGKMRRKSRIKLIKRRRIKTIKIIQRMIERIRA